MIECLPLLKTLASEYPRPLVFATVSGAHLYGFPSADSDFDLRGVHLATPQELFGLGEFNKTIEQSSVREGRKIDIVTHDARKFFRLMLKRNGYVLEQLFSPLVICSSLEHEQLIELGHGCITRHDVHHYLGFAHNQWELFRKENPPRVKPLLYVYRVLLTGIHLMRTGTINANLVDLNGTFELPYIPELIQAKITGTEKQTLKASDLAFHEGEFIRLKTELEQAGESTSLPDEAPARAGLNDLLFRLRRKSCLENLAEK